MKVDFGLGVSLDYDNERSIILNEGEEVQTWKNRA